MRINYNVSAMISNNALSNSEDLLSKSLERLSSGLKINNAKDNPAGLAMAKRMNAQIEGLSKANDNASDGISVIEIADGALAEVHDMLQRMNELSVKACNGTMSTSDRETIQDEVRELSEEIERIAATTEFNSQKILNGEFDLKGYTDNEAVKVTYYSDRVPVQDYKIEAMTLTYDEEEGTFNSFEITFGEESGFPDDVIVKSYNDRDVILTGNDGFEIHLDISELVANKVELVENTTVDITGIGAMRLQIGSNEGQVLEVRIPEISLRRMGIDGINVTSEEGAKDALTRMSDAISYVSSTRSRLGAYQNRLESVVNSLDITSENMTAAYSRIMDVDMAEEMTAYTTNQVLTQAGTSMLAQANERPSQVLQLLQ